MGQNTYFCTTKNQKCLKMPQNTSKTPKIAPKTTIFNPKSSNFRIIVRQKWTTFYPQKWAKNRKSGPSDFLYDKKYFLAKSHNPLFKPEKVGQSTLFLYDNNSFLYDNNSFLYDNNSFLYFL